MDMEELCPVLSRLVISIDRVLVELERNNRKRARFIGLIQMVMFSAYVLIWLAIRDEVLEQEISLQENIQENITVPIEHEKPVLSDDIWKYLYLILDGTWFHCGSDDTTVCFMVFKTWFYHNLTAVCSLLLVWSSTFLICATLQRPPRQLKITLCTLASWINLLFIVLEMAVFAFLYQIWGLPCGLIINNIVLYREARKLLNTIKILAPPPPGYYV